MPYSRIFPAVIFCLGLLACGDEDPTGIQDHTPVEYSVLVDSVAASPPIRLRQDERVTVQLKFFNAAGEDLDELEVDHFAGLAFEPATLATFERVPDHNFRFEVQGASPGDGVMQVSFGHDEEAGELALSPIAVTVIPAGGGHK